MSIIDAYVQINHKLRVAHHQIGNIESIFETNAALKQYVPPVGVSSSFMFKKVGAVQYCYVPNWSAN